MGIFDVFKKKKESELDPIGDLTLSKMKAGDYVDYDMKTWQVTAYHQYEWGHDDITHEWQLKSADDMVFLEMSEDDEVEWCISRKVPFGKLGSDIKDYIIENEDPPDQIMVDGTTYYLDETGSGYFLKNGIGPREELLKWDYIDDSEQQYLSIEQWGETDFEASMGMPVAEYQFSNILPGEMRK